MNAGERAGADLAAAVVKEASSLSAGVELVVCPPFTALVPVGQALSGSPVALGAQNVHPEKSGAFTGEVSTAMLSDYCVKYVILGHSERRALFAESDAFINQKVLAVLAAGLRPILCVGETLEEREAEKTLAVVSQQVKAGLAGVTSAEGVVIAYEPVWAIGTGKTATPEMAQEVHAAIRQLLIEQFGPEGGDSVRILYGGSMKPDNAAELLRQPDIDGGLIGGASLKADQFLAIAKAV